MPDSTQFRRAGVVASVESVENWPTLFRIVLKTDEGERTCSYGTNPRQGTPASPERIAELGIAQRSQISGEIIVVSGYTTTKTGDNGEVTYYNGTAIKTLADWQVAHPNEDPNKINTNQDQSQNLLSATQSAPQTATLTSRPTTLDSNLVALNSTNSNSLATWGLSTVLNNLNHFPNVPENAQERATWLTQKAIALCKMQKQVAQALDDNGDW